MYHKTKVLFLLTISVSVSCLKNFSYALSETIGIYFIYFYFYSQVQPYARVTGLSRDVCMRLVNFPVKNNRFVYQCWIHYECLYYTYFRWSFE